MNDVGPAPLRLFSLFLCASLNHAITRKIHAMTNTLENSSAGGSSLTEILSAAVTIARGAGAILREGIAAIEANRGGGRL